jgi:protein phosphatase
MFDIIGDVHSCYYELVRLLLIMGYVWDSSRTTITHNNRKVVFVGDILDRGPDPVLTFLLVQSMVKNGHLMVKGNHDEKCQRWANGNNVSLTNGLDKTVEEFNKSNIHRGEVLKFFNSLPFFLLLDCNKVLVAHAACKDKYIDRDPYSKTCMPHCIYGPTAKGLNYNRRIDWALQRNLLDSSPLIVHGHQKVKEVSFKNKVYNIDTGCVFGGKLSALRYPEMEIVQVNAFKNYYLSSAKWGY